MDNRAWKALLLLVIVLSAGVLMAGCGGGASGTEIKLAPLAPLSQLPPEIARAPAQVREAYQFAIANQDYLANFPCYCGCGAIGHMSNVDCYIREVRSDGTIVFDDHALG